MNAVEASSRRPVRRQLVWIAVGVLVIAGVAVWATSARALSTDQATASVPAEAGDTFHVGHAGLVDDPLTVRDVGARSDAFDVELWVCEPRPDADIVGVVGDEGLTGYCASLEPLVRGTQLPRHVAGEVGPYVITTLTVRGSGTAVFCGFDVSYRSGWRLGRQEQVAAYRVVVNGDTSVADDVCR